MKTRGAARLSTPHRERPLRVPSHSSRIAAAGKLPESRGRRDWIGGAAGTPLFFLRCPGIGVGRVLCHPNSRPAPNFTKKLLARSYGSDTRRPHWLTHLINLWMENFFILRIKDLTTIPLILCTSSGNGAPPTMVAPQAP